nr:FtsX-like permease family protein [Brucella abortus]
MESRQRQLHNPERYRYLRPCGWLGTTVVKTPFPDGGNPVGDYILIQKIPFQIIGTLEPKGAGFGGSDQDDVVVVPLSTGNLRLFGQKYVRSITVQVKDSSLIDTTQNQIQSLLDQRHKKRDTMITNMSSVREDAAAMGKTMTVFLGSVAAISLLVGGIGVMNIMLVSVTERTREIGVRMATGARRRDILLQFIIEALSVSAIGGAIGVILGLGAAALASWAGLSVGYSFGPVLLAFACAFATGLIFGFLPARKASRLLPAVALSSE